jgi:glycosyltransferase involved in cell wall biosynthesis
MTRINVLHLHTLPVVSGSGINTFMTMHGTPADRFKVSLACAPGGRLNDLVRQAGMEVHEIESLVQPLHPAKDLVALYKILRLLRRERIDLIHTHNSKTGFLGRLAGRLMGTPVVIHTVHGFAFHDAERWVRRRLFKVLEKMAAPWADHTIFISQPMIDWAGEAGILQEGKYSKIYSGIDLKRFRPMDAAPQDGLRAQLGLQDRDRVVGFVSKLWEGKGHAVALEAMVTVVQSIPHAKLLLVGEGPLEEELRAMSRVLGIGGSVIFAGFRTDLPQILSLCDICILPSFFEGMGRVLLEAGACGRAVVASRVGGIPEIVENGATGSLVPPEDPAALSREILCLLGDPGLAQMMGERARQRIGEMFSSETMVREIVAVYDACLQKRPDSPNPTREGEGLYENHYQRRKVG